MKYKGIELTPITEVQAFEEPREMLVWDEIDKEPKVKDVVAIVNRYHESNVITIHNNLFKYCAEIPQTKTRERTVSEKLQYLKKKESELGDGEFIMARHCEHEEGYYCLNKEIYIDFLAHNKYTFAILKDDDSIEEFEISEIEV